MRHEGHHELEAIREISSMNIKEFLFLLLPALPLPALVASRVPYTQTAVEEETQG